MSRSNIKVDKTLEDRLLKFQEQIFRETGKKISITQASRIWAAQGVPVIIRITSKRKRRIEMVDDI